MTVFVFTSDSVTASLYGFPLQVYKLNFLKPEKRILTLQT